MLLALHPGKDVQGQPYLPLKERYDFLICWEHLDISSAVVQISKYAFRAAASGDLLHSSPKYLL